VNAIRKWRKSRFKTQGDAAVALGVPRPTYQTYESGRSEVPQELQPKFRELGFEEEFPEAGDEGVTQEDLQALGRDLSRIVGNAEESLSEQIQVLRDENMALGAALQELLKRTEHLSESPVRAKSPSSSTPL
jgi:transcriptional regulator with XRE-family HTH domain